MFPKTLNGWQRLWVAIGLFYGAAVAYSVAGFFPNEAAIYQRWAEGVIEVMQDCGNRFGGEFPPLVRSSTSLRGKSDREIAEEFIGRVNSEPPRVVAKFEVSAPDGATFSITAPYWSDEGHVLAVAQSQYPERGRGPWEKYAQRSIKPVKPSIEDLERAARNAELAGDQAAARVLNAEIVLRRRESQLQDFSDWWSEERSRQQVRLTALGKLKQVELAELLMSQIKTIGAALALWLLPMIALYLFGIMVAWVFRGFFPKKGA